MPKSNNENAQKIVRSVENLSVPGRHTYASVQSDVGKPSKERPRPVEKPEKKGE